MAEKFFPFPSVAGDREYRAEDFAEFFADIISDGVAAYGAGLTVTWSSGMFVDLGSGHAWIKGHQYKNETTRRLGLSVGGAYPRIDRLVVRLDAANRRIGSLIVPGTPASDPVPAALTRNGDYWDLCLATIRVPASASVLESSYITDTRADTTVCGFIRCPLEVLDAASFFQNSQNSFDEWFLGKKASAESLTLAKLQAQIDTINARKVDYVVRTTRSPVAKRRWGDLNNDGSINNADLSTLARYVSGQITGDGLTLDACDFNGDGRVDESDQQFLARALVRMSHDDQILQRVETHYTDSTKEVTWELIDPPTT